MVSRVVSRSFLSVLTLSLMIGLPGPARAQMAAMKAFQDSLTQMDEKTKEALLGQAGLTGKVEKSFDKLIEASEKIQSEEMAETQKASPIYAISVASQMLPQALALTTMTSESVMVNRIRELNHVDMGPGKADYLVDSYQDIPRVDMQYFDIFMRYFCDPEARDNSDAKGKKLGDKKWPVEQLIQGKVSEHDIGCGTSGDSPLDSRQKIWGNEAHTAPDAQNLISLPLRPDVLFFNAQTFPTRPSGAPNEENVNKKADVYYGAFAMAMRFLLGPPPEVVILDNGLTNQVPYVESKAQIARMSLASMPFAELFSAQMGTMDKATVITTADMLTEKFGNATINESIKAKLDAMRLRNTMSLAEYMDIVMYQLPMSPNYYARINHELNPTELKREAVWLMGMQTALNYQRNRWLEMLAALEAVK